MSRTFLKLRSNDDKGGGEVIPRASIREDGYQKLLENRRERRENKARGGEKPECT